MLSREATEPLLFVVIVSCRELLEVQKEVSERKIKGIGEREGETR